MRAIRYRSYGLLVGLIAAALIQPACQSESSWRPQAIQRYEERNTFHAAVLQDTQEQPVLIEEPDVLLDRPPAAESTTRPVDDGIGDHVPDLEAAYEKALQGRETAEGRERIYHDHVVHLLDEIRRPDNRVELTLEDVIRNTIEYNYTIESEGYGPAISAADTVEAEANFDAVLFLTFENVKQDTPTATQLQGTTNESRTFEAGIGKLLSTGGQIQSSYQWNRQYTDLAFQTINPAYTSRFIVAITQPLLRNFGQDVNRATIYTRRNEYRINRQRYRRSIIEQLSNVEQAYWQLVQVRREAAISARLLAVTELLYDFLQERRILDAYRIQIEDTKSTLSARRSDYIRIRNAVRDAEDQLKSLINDPELNLSQDIEIVPIEQMASAPVVMDRVGEVQTALQERPEIREAKLTIENAKIQVGYAKNQLLPRFDLTFQYQVNGLGESADQSFDQLTTNRFIDYTVGLEFEWPIGNRGPEAALRRARLQRSQAVAQLKGTIEGVILEVNTALRRLQSAYERLDTDLEGCDAAFGRLQALMDRAEQRDPLYLDQELSAQSTLATQRQRFLQSLVEYQTAVIGVEQAKGTLAQYNNIYITEPEPREIPH